MVTVRAFCLLNGLDGTACITKKVIVMIKMIVNTANSDRFRTYRSILESIGHPPVDLVRIVSVSMDMYMSLRVVHLHKVNYRQ